MPIKIKIGIALVAVIAVFSVYELGKYVHTLAINGPMLANTSSLGGDTQNCATCDPDHDGLTNAEEVLWNTDPLNADTDGDGFKDGEEVASGHNPLIPGPNDLINSDNLTDQLSQLTVAGILAGALNPASASYNQTLADITSSVADSGKYLFNKTVDPDSLMTVIGNVNTNATYVKEVLPLIQKFSNALNNQVGRLTDDLNQVGNKGFNDQLKKYYAQQAGTFETLSGDTETMTTPKAFAANQASLISIIRQMYVIDDAIAHGDTDVVKATLAMEALGSVPEKYLEYLSSFIDTIQAEHIDITSFGN